ncbi:MAG TPA: diguanylate cyclase [Candidatus Competibacteraceae bacterium]|nr:diguanylate cyclase [Candidatus Competibacteraceae bacterium]
MMLWLRKPHILIVDDVPANVEMLGEALQEHYEIQFAPSGAKALRLADEEPPDLILLDIMMPEMDGYEVYRQLRAMPKLSETPVIFVTAMDEAEAETRGLALGAVDYITKPIHVEIARLRIRNLLERERLRTDLALALSGSGHGLWECDPQRQLLAFDPDWCAPLGYAPGEMNPCVQPWTRIIHPDHLHLFQKTCAASPGNPDRVDIEVQLRNRAGGWTWVSLHGAQVQHPSADPAPQIKGVFADISARKAMENELVRLATTDPLTDVANRRHFLERLEDELTRVRRYEGNATLLMLDLDHFKQVNDRFGHASGDEVLRHFTALTRDTLRRPDLLGRIGGEEFAILLPGTDIGGAQSSAERLLQRIASTPAITSRGLKITFTVSIGLTALAVTDHHAEHTLARADSALYKAKTSGRNRVAVVPAVPMP